MRIAIVVHGRFHAFDLAKALIKRGHQVIVYTNYPAWAARKFGLPADAIQGYWWHGVIYRILYKLSRSGRLFDASEFLNPVFGRWVARHLQDESYDVIHSFSGIACELLASRSKGTVHLVVRGSAHIAAQDAILNEEELRANRKIERPSAAIIAREEWEYEAADRVVVLSTFAYDSFVRRGIDKTKLALLRLGVDVSQFRATDEVLEARRLRIARGDPLRILWVGSMSLRKGLLDYVEMVRALAGENFQFRFVGDLPGDLGSIIKDIADKVDLVPRQRQWDLREQYGWGDLFVFPTVEDGFGVVLAQANANGLPILTTPNCAGPDMIREGVTGWVLPIRSPEAFVNRLRWCDKNRDAVVAMVKRIEEDFVPRTWDDVAAGFEGIYQDTIQTSQTEYSADRVAKPRRPKARP